MRKMIWRKFTNRIWIFILGILGITVSCGKYEYGTPSADFITTGKVINSQTKTGIENIKVVMTFDTARTDANGNFSILKHGFPHVPDTFHIKCLDMDSIQKGYYENKDTSIIFTENNFTGGDGGWYRGKTTKNIEIPLKPKS